MERSWPLGELMKILHMNPAFYPAFAYGGTVNVSYNLCKELVKRGHDVTVYTSDTIDEHKRHLQRYSIQEGIKIHYFKNLSNSLAWRRFFFYPGLIIALKNNIQRFDVIHLHDLRNFQN
ncbi:MAG TPA: glycosyltransferase, partial [Methanomassiliicoccaceae archaeon]|nr:glycosyltransferase [Methanomassiliicoccaceae archaeon]